MERIFWAVGNHDVSRENKLRNEIILRLLRKDSNCDSLFEEYMKDNDFYKIFTSNCMGDFFDWHKKLLKREPYQNTVSPHSQHKLINLNLVVLNTCLTSCDNDDERHLLIIEQNLLDIFKYFDSSNPTFVIGHHGQEFFTPSSQDRIGHLFDTGNVDLYLCGHSHRLGYGEFPQAKRDIPQITCGGGTLDGYSKLSFMYGYYKSDAHEVNVKAYGYAEGNRNWQLDNTLHRKLGSNNQIKLTGVRNPPKAIGGKVTKESYSAIKNNDVVQKDWASSFFRSTNTKFKGM
jgi:hypothetical protein